MSNERYISGRLAEYRLRDNLRALGYTVLRTAGSHGAFDLIAVHSKEPVRLIQVKSGKHLTETTVTKRLKEFSESPPLPYSDRGIAQPESYTQELHIYNRTTRKWSSVSVG